MPFFSMTTIAFKYLEKKLKQKIRVRKHNGLRKEL